MQKVHGYYLNKKIAPIKYQQKISSSFHPPLGSFHLSLTVLVHYRYTKMV